jgi:P2-related tail formation protein
MVAHWESEDSPAVKRSQVASAKVERRKSGTREGIEIAIRGLGFNCEYTSRYESPSLPPFTLEIIAWRVEPRPIRKLNSIQLTRKLDEIKSVRDTVGLKLGRFWLGDHYFLNKLSKGKELRFKD